MAELTRAIGKGLNAARRVLRGGVETCELLDHAPIGQRGYVRMENGDIGDADGWHFKLGRLGETSQIVVTESAQITDEMLTKTVAFLVDGKVWKRVAGDFSSPLGSTFRVWRFNVTPSGEQVFD